MVFENRQTAGDTLASSLSSYAESDAVVIGLARGGVPVAYRIATLLHLTWDVLVVKKISSPADRELAIGALAPDGISDIDWQLAGRVGADSAYVENRIRELGHEIKITQQLFRLPKKRISVSGRTVILTDDGIATGASVRAAVKWLRAKKAEQVVIAVPVMPSGLADILRHEADEIVAVSTPADFVSVGSYYKNFSQITNQHVLELLRNGKE